jgi:hypothetical protein
LALWLSFGICAASVFWIADGVAPWDVDTHNVWHHYEYLAEGFASGHTYLSLEPPQELLNLKDPYDPAANLKYRLWDASLFRGKYYLYYGPAPALALMVPWRIATGHMLPQRFAVAIFAAAGLAALALLLWDVRQRCFPGLSGPALGAILITAFHATWLPVVVRRPAFWELPIVSAAACLWWALYFLWKFRDSGGRTRWAAAVGVSLALLIGCRVNCLFVAGAILLFLLVPFGSPRATKWGAAAAAAAFVTAAGLALLAYNWARFGSFVEFGRSYQLWGRDERGLPFLQPSFIPFNAWTYLLSLPNVGPYFPFLHGTWPSWFPKGYVGYEEMYGASFAMPVHLAGIAALAWAWRSRTISQFRAAGIALAAAVCSSALAGAILFCWLGACSRYITELFAGWVIATSLGMMVVFGSVGPARFGRLARLATAAAACWTIACVWLASAEFRGFMKQTNPRTYAAVAHALDYPSQWWIELRGIHFAPVDITVRIPDPSSRSETVLVASGFPERLNQLIIRPVDDTHVQLILNSNWFSVLEAPALPVRGGRLELRLSAPWLYPPSEHPFWDRVGDQARRTELGTLFSLQVGPDIYSTHSVHRFDPSGFEPTVLDSSHAGQGTPYVESLRKSHPGQ